MMRVDRHLEPADVADAVNRGPQQPHVVGRVVAAPTLTVRRGWVRTSDVLMGRSLGADAGGRVR